MIARVWPGALAGRVPAIVSKSAAHRALILAALADGPTLLIPEAHSDDIDATLGCLRALGASYECVEAGKGVPGGILVRPGACAPGGEADCRESGSTLRFLIPVAAALGAAVRFTGRGRLPERPLGPLVEALQSRGCAFSAPMLPFTLSGRLIGGEFQLPGDVSSQFITGLLLALPRAGGGRILLTSSLESRGYVAMTIQSMARFGVSVREIGGDQSAAEGAEGAAKSAQAPMAQAGEKAAPFGGWEVPAAAYRSPGVVEVEGDWSSTAFFLAAGAEVTGLDQDSAQPDRAILELLKAFDAPERVLDVRETPDLLPILAAVAATTPGETRFTGAARLRIKESDRLRAMAEGIRAIGGFAEEAPAGLTVRCAGAPAGGAVDACRDHRIAMAFAIAATRCAGPVAIRGAEAARKSYPTFFDDFRRLGGRVDVL